MIRDMLKIVVVDFFRGISNHVGKHDLFEQRGERPKASKYTIPQNNTVQSTNQQQTSSNHTIHVDAEKDLFPTILNCVELEKRKKQPHWKIWINWATWCEGCIDEFPILRDLIEVLNGLSMDHPIDIYGISWDNFMFHDLERSQEEIRNFYLIQESPPPFSTCIIGDDDTTFFEHFNMSYKKVPQLWLIDPQGTSKVFQNAIGLEEILEIQECLQNQESF